ncbi:MAG: putative O-glycosylation ligase, exosortase A system-associated [Magnetococcales bacterium]|nr:putative O-glycosylation ligase, exosortase A system-associated [Magnetococcales bacterium]
MRDLVLTLFIFGMLPYAFLRPVVGLYLWAWISYMNPHRLTWSYAYSFRFNYFVAIITILGVVFFWRKREKIPSTGPVFLLTLFFIWVCLSTLLAFSPGGAWIDFVRFFKIYLMLLITFLTVGSRRSITILVVIIAVSIGFFGIKGGVFTILTGGQFHILGPEDSFFYDNNTFALAEVMVIPLFMFFRTQLKNRWLRLFVLICTVLAVIAVIGSYSRGGLVGLMVVIFFFWLRTPGKIKITVFIPLVMVVIFSSMPEKWQDRMSVLAESVTVIKPVKDFIEDPPNLFESRSAFDESNNPFNLDETDDDFFETEESRLLADMSVQGRFQAWGFAWNLALDRPIFGGGFHAFTQRAYDIYYPGVIRRDAHSIYFEVMGEQGFGGLLIWLLLHFSVFRMQGSIVRRTKNVEELLWAHELARYMGIGLLGYYSAGAFLGLAYFDLPFHYLAIIIILQKVVNKELSNRPEPERRNRFPYVSPHKNR